VPWASREHLNAEIQNLLSEIGRYGSGQEAQQGVLIDEIGNLCREYGDPRAPTWYAKALELWRVGYPEPNSRAALILWKAGDFAASKEECDKVIDLNEKRLRLPLADPERMTREHSELAIAHFLRGEYEMAADCAERAAGRSPAAKPTAITALARIAKGLAGKDIEVFESGLSVLRALIKEWPTYGSGATLDLYRFALSLRDGPFPGGA